MITPQEARELVELSRTLPTHEARLDKELRAVILNNAHTGDLVNFAVAYTSSHIADAMLDRLTRAGWHAEVNFEEGSRANSGRSWTLTVNIKTTLGG